MASKRILVAPLNWGLGHATRCMPIIDAIAQKGLTPVIGAYGRSKALLKREYPNFEMHDLPGFDFKYSARSQHLGLLKQLPAYLRSIKSEHEELESFVFKHKISGVISDNRYGLWAEKVPSVLLTHQLNPIGQGLTRWFEGMASKRIKKLSSRFSFVWLPDNKAHTLSGQLSEQREMWNELRYVGLLSRFNRPEKRSIENDIVVVLSGPEPARSQFDKEIMRALSALQGKKILVIRALPEAPELQIKGNINVVNYLGRSDLEKAILGAKLVISRSGYSSIMDYARLGVKAAFIPTPGQTEQLFLAEHLMENKIAPFQQQKDINLSSLIASLPYFSGFKSLNIEAKLEGPLNEFIRRL